MLIAEIEFPDWVEKIDAKLRAVDGPVVEEDGKRIITKQFPEGLASVLEAVSMSQVQQLAQSFGIKPPNSTELQQQIRELQLQVDAATKPRVTISTAARK